MSDPDRLTFELRTAGKRSLPAGRTTTKDFPHPPGGFAAGILMPGELLKFISLRRGGKLKWMLRLLVWIWQRTSSWPAWQTAPVRIVERREFNRSAGF